MTGADNPDEIWKPSKAFKRLEKLGKKMKKPTRRRKKEVPWQHYPSISILTSSSRLRRMLLGKHLYWTIKEDGENVTIWKKKKQHSAGYEFVVSSHNQGVAALDIQVRCRKDCLEDYVKILALIEDNPTFRISAEECKKGTSVTRIKKYPRATLIIFDIFDTAIMNFLPYTLVYQHCYHYGIPVVKLHGITRHKTIKDLLKYKNHVLEVCEAIKEEGMVAKTFVKNKRCMDCGKDWVKKGECMGCHSKHIEEVEEYVQAKVKLDTPEPKERIIHEGQVQLPQIPESEIMGAISHVEADFGLTGEPKDDMPRIANAVAEECKKHLYSSRSNLFKFYQEYMESRK